MTKGVEAKHNPCKGLYRKQAVCLQVVISAVDPGNWPAKYSCFQSKGEGPKAREHVSACHFAEVQIGIPSALRLTSQHDLFN